VRNIRDSNLVRFECVISRGRHCRSWVRHIPQSTRIPVCHIRDSSRDNFECVISRKSHWGVIEGHPQPSCVSVRSINYRSFHRPYRPRVPIPEEDRIKWYQSTLSGLVPSSSTFGRPLPPSNSFRPKPILVLVEFMKITWLHC
jgi:hypothetical protein